jgi:diguanylate cyclase (GGDEF)-like protein
LNTALLSTIVNSDALPSMPAVAFKVLELCRQDDVSINAVADVIAKDPALTARMLKVANSSIFGMSKKVATLSQAMVVLGLRTVKIMALGFSLVDTLHERSRTGFDYARYWRRSMSTAVAARQLAEVLGDVRKDEAFVGGMLCDIGMVAAERHPDGMYETVVQQHQAQGGRIQDIERAVLGVTHAQISAMMLAHWSMPEIMSHAVASHHGDGFDQLDPRTKVMAGALWAASEMAELFCGDTDPAQFAVVWDKVINLVGITPAALDGVMEVLNSQVREAAEMFCVKLTKEVSYDDLRQHAVQQLAQLSLSAERERASAETEVKQARNQLQTLNQLNAELKVKAETDRLTGVANRQSFETHLDHSIETAAQTSADLGLILLDLDHFKKLNDSHGHQAGDEALRLVGKCLNKITDSVRFAARYGGEEFAVVVSESTARELRELAEDVRKSIGRIRFTHGGQELTITASLGATHVSFREETVDAAEMIRRADECLYDAKREGRNRVEITF